MGEALNRVLARVVKDVTHTKWGHHWASERARPASLVGPTPAGHMVRLGSILHVMTLLFLAKSCPVVALHRNSSKNALFPTKSQYAPKYKVSWNDKDLFTKNPELVKEAQRILKKCGGLPLAIDVIGGFLANRPKTLEEWRKLNENISAELEINPELGMIRTVLEKSYDGLPFHLKSCFLYLAIFPEDQTISRRRLVRCWAAEGYSIETRGKTAIEIADDYFMELHSRSMILSSQQSIYGRITIDSCRVHDLIRDIAISKSMEENLVFRLEEGCGLSTRGVNRHLAISSNWDGDQSEFESTVDQSRLRSLTVFGNFRPFYISDKMRLLRVFDLQDIYNLRYYQLDHIWKLIHLKYLSLRGCLGIDFLPDSLGNLRQLQVLDVKDTWVKALPKTIMKLRKLQYIHAGQKIDYVTENKESLTSRTGLRNLGVTGINRKNSSAFRQAICSLSRLESLSVRSTGEQGLRGCLDGISPPPENLQSLKLYGTLETLPEWIKDLSRLVKLTLAESRLLEHDAAMEFLGKLPKLEILVLCRASNVKEKIDFKSLQDGIAFERLRVLWYASVYIRIKSLKFEEGTMPKLERLHFVGFADDKFVVSGLELLPSINEVKFRVYFPGDVEKIRAAQGELKRKIQEQLAGNTNEPIVTVD
ncbi:hypothetical protein HU200_034450 [Digitaria exilis]|uniref:NB-ARC domain-containing protein n=1 Tax=Digitaria exilis TaxID=1010633 RepID=A0A835BTJ3_9POAL|nr:hypothetical protein HU200_034450 [Digitaria exilis]